MSTRMSAEQRRSEIVELALPQFAMYGYRGTSTETIARAAGISQPYLFRLFKTKRELFLACNDLCDERILHTFRTAAEGVPREEALSAMGQAYVELLQDRTALLFQMQSYAACSDPVIQDHVRRGFGVILAEVTRLSGAAPEEAWEFFAHGMLLNVVASLDLAAIAGQEEWASVWATPVELIRLAS